jgi:hypothetical protein
MSCGICIGYSWRADFGEAPVATLPSQSLRRSRMTEPQKTRKRVSSPPGKCRQISMAFESTGLLGLTGAERMKVVIQLSRVLMLAAGVAAEERDDER